MSELPENGLHWRGSLVNAMDYLLRHQDQHYE